MRISHFLFILIISLAGSLSAFAQGALSGSDLKNVDIDRLSDADIRSYYAKAAESGLSEDQLYELSKTRGLSDLQVSKLRDRVAMLGLSGMTSGAAASGGMMTGEQSAGPANTNEAVRKFDEKLGKVPMEIQSFNKRIYGSELFSETSTTFEPNLRIATPTNYVIGPDDELIINVFGYSEKTYRQVVNAEGNIYIENAGPILVSGLTIEDAEAKIRARLGNTIYRAMKSGATKMQLRLGNIRSMRITIIGEAKRPGTYTVSSLTTIFNALYLCGGPNDQGSYRNIEVIRGNKVVRKIDLYSFIAFGDKSDNILLQEQDVIRIPFYDARMVFEGYVKRPGIYEIKENEAFDKLFEYAGKFSDSAYRKSVTIYQITDERLSIKNLPADQFGNYYPRIADSVYVSTATMRYANRVKIRGAVYRPGDYELTAEMDLKQLIEKAGGLREDAYMGGGNILRTGDDLGLENVSFTTSLIKNGEEKIILKKEDEIIINSIFDIRDKYTVSIEGEINKPGTYEWRKDLRVRDLVLLAGGVSESTGFTSLINIEISRRVRDADVKGMAFKQSEIIKIVVSQNLNDQQALVSLEPFDMLVVRPQPGYQQQRSVFLNGPVMYPGRYFLEKSGERITDLLMRAGGFKSSADSSSIFIRRFMPGEMEMETRKELISKLSNITEDSIRKTPKLLQELEKNYTSLSVNLEKAFDKPGGNDDIILEAGDIILVSQSSSLVKVSGEVYFPTLIPYEPKTNVKYYIRRTGDYTSSARKNQTFVIYPDGKAEGVKKFLFFKSYPKVTPRSEIFVPSKMNKDRTGLTTGEWVAISSILATLTTLIVSVINSN
jgi:protein involved in polysaccharide export with SLBB domain